MARSSTTTSHQHDSRKRKAPGAWKKVEVELPDDGAGEEDNHYDNRRLQRSAEKDLESTPAEDMGFFLGLEVISGDEYRVENRNGTQMLVFNEKVSADKGEESKAASATTEQDETEERPKKKRKKKKKKSKGQDSDDQNAETTPNSTDDINPAGEATQADPPSKEATAEASKKTVKKKKKKKPKKATEMEQVEDETGQVEDKKDDVVDEEQITRMQTAWMGQTGGVTLHEDICKALVLQDFWVPTPIQAGCLPAAILGRRNIVGAAPTGSGKTLAFFLPIFQSLFEEEERLGDGKGMTNPALKALVIAPTRELSKQLVAECEKIASKRVALVVGGLAHVKQRRLLSRRPPIVVGTPGRLWEMVRTLSMFGCTVSRMINNIPTNHYLYLSR